MNVNNVDDDNISSLLDEVFKEVDSLNKSSGFLEDVAAAEIDLALNKKKLDVNETEKNQKNQSNALSLISEVNSSIVHEGLTDSSDDETEKYFHESKYNEYGKNIKTLLKQTALKRNNELIGTSRNDCLKKNDENSFTDEEKKAANLAAKEKLKKYLENAKWSNKEEIKGNGFNAVEVDPIFHMRIIKPLVSSASLQEKMIGRISVGTMKIKKFLENSDSKNVDWVTGGVITNKFSKTSQKGNVYIIWEISDLLGDIKIITVFLFGSAYKEFWTKTIGTVVGILNPDVLNNSKNNYSAKNEATLRVDNPHKILVIGTSKDYGTCKSKTKSGDACRNVVNVAKCEFCSRHLQTEYKKASRRTDLQPPKIGRLMDLKKKFFDQNQSSRSPRSFGSEASGKKMPVLITGRKSSKQVEKDRQRLQALSSDAVNTRDTFPHNNSKTQSKSMTTVSNTSSPCGLQNSHLEKKSQLNHPPLEIIDLNMKITAEERSKAKAFALNYVRKHGPIKAPPTVDRKEKRTPEQIASIKRKLEVVEENKSNLKKPKTAEQATAEVIDPKKAKLEKLGMNDKFFELMNATTKDQKLLDTAEKDQQERYFDKLETREKMENKMASIFKVECNAVRCLKCHYKAFSASDLCKREKHPLKVFKTFKKFWKCSNCPSRTVSIELYPLHPCKTCGNPKWERASMMPEKGPNLTIEPLSLRGMEEKFVGSVVKNANLNLLVPDEGTSVK